MALLKTKRSKLKPSQRFKVKLPEKRVDPFYQSPAWLALCEMLKATRWPHLMATRGHCCEDPDCTAKHKPGGRIYFDHIEERKDAPHLALEPSNIMGRCGASHSRKSAKARAERYGVGGPSL